MAFDRVTDTGEIEALYYDVRDELDDYDRADMDDSEIEYLEERLAERDADKLEEAAFWQAVNNLALEFPTFTVSVIPEN